MNFFKLYIGDYLRDTGTLTLAQHGAYMLMLMEHYAREKPLPTGRELHRLLRADNKAERDAIDFVVSRFWTAIDGGLVVNARATEEIERAAHQRAINQEIGRRGGRPKKTESVSESDTETEPSREPNRNPNQTPDTRHSSLRSEKVSKASPSHPPGGGNAGRFAEFWSAWPKNERKQDKSKCLDHWRRRSLDSIADAILADVRVKRGTEKWRDGFIEAPLVYLRGRRWEDGVEPKAAESPKTGGEIEAIKAHDAAVAAMSPEQHAAAAAALAKARSALKVVA